MRDSIALVGLCVAAVGCAHGGSRADPQVLMRADEQFAKDVGERGLEAWLAWFAPDGAMLPAGSQRAVGREKIAEIMQRLGDPRKAKPDLVLVWKPVVAAISEDGTLGYTIGNSRALTPEGERLGKYLTVWRRQPDGTWKVAEDLGNSAWATTDAP